MLRIDFKSPKTSRAFSDHQQISILLLRSLPSRLLSAMHPELDLPEGVGGVGEDPQSGVIQVWFGQLSLPARGHLGAWSAVSSFRLPADWCLRFACLQHL